MRPPPPPRLRLWARILQGNKQVLYEAFPNGYFTSVNSILVFLEGTAVIHLPVYDIGGEKTVG